MLTVKEKLENKIHIVIQDLEGNNEKLENNKKSITEKNEKLQQNAPKIAENIINTGNSPANTTEINTNMN